MYEAFSEGAHGTRVTFTGVKGAGKGIPWRNFVFLGPLGALLGKLCQCHVYPIKTGKQFLSIYQDGVASEKLEGFWD